MGEKMSEFFAELMLRFHHLGEEMPPFDELGITPAQFYYINFIAENSPCSLKQVTEGLGFSPASVSLMLKHLENKGLISKNGNLLDKRSLDLELTGAGSQLFQKVDRYRKQKAAMALSRLSTIEQEQFLMLFEKILKNS